MNNRDGLAPAVASILDAARQRPTPDERVAVEPRDLHEAFACADGAGRVPVVAEVKPTSPTTEGLDERDPVDLAREMVTGGAAALSVLTEPEHFGGSVETLRRVREAVDVPVLRKDFLLEESHLDVAEADIVLLIARFVDDLPAMLDAARDRGFQALVEVHDRTELEDALAAGADIVGVNNRDLTNLVVNLETFETVAPHVPEDVLLLAESGIALPAEAARMRRAGADGLLVGTGIMRGPDSIAENTRRLTTPMAGQ